MLIRSVRHRRWLIARTAAAAIAAGGVATAAAAGIQVKPLRRRPGRPPGRPGRVLPPDEPVIAPYGQRTQFTDQPIGPAVGSDGARVAAQTGDLKFHKPSLRIVDAATGAVAQSFGSTGVAAPTYSADGSALYAITRISIQKVADTVTHPARLNRYDWVSATNSSKPYAGDDQILASGQVPSRNLPSDFFGD